MKWDWLNFFRKSNSLIHLEWNYLISPLILPEVSLKNWSEWVTLLQLSHGDGDSSSRIHHLGLRILLSRSHLNHVRVHNWLLLLLLLGHVILIDHIRRICLELLWLLRLNNLRNSCRFSLGRFIANWRSLGDVGFTALELAVLEVALSRVNELHILLVHFEWKGGCITYSKLEW